MKVIKTELSVRKINARMKRRGFTPHKSKLSSLVTIYVKDDARIMYVFDCRIKQFNLSFGEC